MQHVITLLSDSQTCADYNIDNFFDKLSSKLFDKFFDKRAMVATFGSIGDSLGHVKERLENNTVAIQTIANIVRILFNDLFRTLDTSISFLKTHARLHFHNLRLEDLLESTLKLIKDNPGTATKTFITAFPILFPKLSWTLVLSIVGLSTHGPTVGKCANERPHFSEPTIDCLQQMGFL